MKKLILITLAIFSIALPQQLLSLETTLPIVWAGSAALETLALLSKDVQHMIYGNNPVNDSIKKTLQNHLPHDLSLPSDIHESRSLWPLFAGNIYSNHDSVFIDKSIVRHIESGAPLTHEAKKELISTALMIKNNCDAKILAAYIAMPAIVWASIHYLDVLLQKINTQENIDYPWLKKLASLVEKCKESFEAKALISLGIVAAYMLYQKYYINEAAKYLLCMQ